jgi:pilus assembly protein CpaB
MGRWEHHTRTLAPLLRERWDARGSGSGFGRTLLLRRIGAGLLVGLAVIMALTPGQGESVGDAVMVAARDLPPGTVLGAGEVTRRELPAEMTPDGAVQSEAAVLGRTLAAPVRRGEPLTDVRLTGSELARAASANPDAVSVPLRLADPGVAALLHIGAAVDVVTIGERQDEPVVLAHDARVLAVLKADNHTKVHDGELVLVALDPIAATRVAAASISKDLTVTVR